MRDPLLIETPEIRENLHFPEHGAVSTKAAPDSHIQQVGGWTLRSETTQTVTSEQPLTISARDVPPAPQARMRNTFVKMQKQRFQNPSIESIDPSEPAAPILPQSVVSDVPTITLERQSVTAGSVKLASPTSKPVQPIALPQIQPTEHLPSICEKPTPNAAPREKPRRGAAIRTRESISVDAATIPPKSPHQKNATKQARKTATQDAQRKMLQKSNRTAKTAKATAKKLGEAAAKATKELLSALVSLGGGTALFVLFCVIVVAGAFLASPLGILFADEQQAEDTVPLATAIAEIQGEYHSELERLQSGDFSSVQIIGQAPDWREVVAVFASKTAGAEDGMDVFTLDEERVELLREVFGDMCQIETQTETVQHEDGERSTALTITITAKTAAQMRLEYDFSKYQNDALDILLENLGGLNIPMGSLTISQENAITLLENLTDDLEPARKAVVETAVQLVGKVTYFWGGKSLTLGWDERWGMPMEVTAAGSGSTGTVRPFGLDCSGFVDWTFYNATNGAYYPGRGGGAATQHSYCTDISWSKAQPGDLVFYPDDSHVGIVGGKDTDGNWLIVHCSGGANGVVITGAAGFTTVARPDCFPNNDERPEALRLWPSLFLCIVHCVLQFHLKRVFVATNNRFRIFDQSGFLIAESLKKHTRRIRCDTEQLSFLRTRDYRTEGLADALCTEAVPCPQKVIKRAIREDVRIQTHKAALWQISRFNHQRILFCRTQANELVKQGTDRITGRGSQRTVSRNQLTGDDLILNQNVNAFQRVGKGIERRQRLGIHMRFDVDTVALHGVDRVCIFQHIKRLMYSRAADVIDAAQAFFAGKRLVFHILSVLNVAQDFLIYGNIKRIVSHTEASSSGSVETF